MGAGDNHRSEGVWRWGLCDGLIGRGGDDTVKGRAGVDELRGGRGADTVHGNRGEDYMVGGRGGDLLRGGGADDAIIADDGQEDYIDCGAGDLDYVDADSIGAVKRYTHIITIDAEVPPDRRGHIMETDFLGCTLYWYEYRFR